MDRPVLSRIRIYPIKSLDPVEVTQAQVGLRSLLHDREFAMLTLDGHFMNGKRTGRVNELKAEYDLQNQTVKLSLRAGGVASVFHLHHDQKKLEAFFTDFFGEPISMVYNLEGQLMDIPDASSVTVVSEASLLSLHHDFSDRSLEDLRLRFRVNLEISGVEPYWEERLFGDPSTGIKFTLGEVEMIGISPRARCNVPPRDPLMGISDKSFVKRMMKSRETSLPAGSVLRKHGSLYQLTVNTFLPDTQEGKWLRVGDPVKIIKPVKLSAATELPQIQ